MMRHALHSPNITAGELVKYYIMPLPERDHHSFIEMTRHNASLLKYLSAPLDGRLTRELVKSAATVVPMPQSTHSTSNMLANLFKWTYTWQHAPRNPAEVPLKKFVTMVIKKSQVKVRTLVYTLLVIDRLREKLPPIAQGMACSGHRIFLAALVVTSKYLNDCNPKNKHWAYWTRSIFQAEEISLMEKQLLELLQFDLHFTEVRIVQRLRPLIVEQVKPKSTRLTINPRQHIPLTPITPTSNVAIVSGDNAIIEPKPGKALMVRRKLARLETAKDFVSQAVPTLEKWSNANDNNEQALGTTIPSSLSVYGGLLCDSESSLDRA